MLSETFYFADKPRHRGDDLALWFMSSTFKQGKTREELVQLIQDTKTSQTSFMVSPVIGLTLMRSVQMSRIDVISCLISEGASINTWFRGRTMLHEAVKICNYPMLEFLLSIQEIEKDRPDVEYKTPLMEAALGKPKCLKILLEAGCDMTMTDQDGNAALHHTLYASRALREDVIMCLDLFLAYGVDINMRCDRGKTCLHKAVETRNLLTMEWLILHNCDINAAMIPLHKRGSSDRLRGGGVLYSTPLNSATPLLLAMKKADRQLVEVLIACGCHFRQYTYMIERCRSYKLLYHSLKYCLKTVTSLQVSCRNVIRQCLSTNIKSEVKFLGLPSSLQRFIMCYDDLVALRSSSLLSD